MKKLLLLTAAITAFSLPAMALELHEARSKGMIGEKLDGYVAPISSAPEAAALAAQVNAKRKEEYTRISKQNGQPVDVVAKLAAPEIIQGLEPGAMVQDASGNWKKH